MITLLSHWTGPRERSLSLLKKRADRLPRRSPLQRRRESDCPVLRRFVRIPDSPSTPVQNGRQTLKRLFNMTLCAGDADHSEAAHGP